MAGIIKRLSKFVRGETETEYLQRQAATSRIRASARAATFKARKEESIKFAESRERLIRESQERKLRQRLNPPKRANLPSIRNTPFTGSGFGMMAGYSPPRTRTVRRKKGRGRTVTRYVNAPRPQRYDVLGI